jgi:IclR family acetate operon transcriptional repressor
MADRGKRIPQSNEEQAMPRPRSTETANYQVRALQRGLSILGLLSSTERRLGLGDISQQLGIPKPTALRLLDYLRGDGFVDCNAAGEYALGLRAFQLGSGSRGLARLEDLARPFLQQLVDQTSHTANLGVIDDGEIVHLAVVEPSRPLRYHTRVGTREPLHCTGLGKVLAAALDESSLQRILDTRGLPAWTPATITDAAAFRRELSMIRRLGFAEDREEATPGLRCIAAPVRGDSGQVVAAISISGPAAEFARTHAVRLRQIVLEVARRLSERLGWVDVPPTVRARKGTTA